MMAGDGEVTWDGEDAIDGEEFRCVVVGTSIEGLRGGMIVYKLGKVRLKWLEVVWHGGWDD